VCQTDSSFKLRKTLDDSAQIPQDWTPLTLDSFSAAKFYSKRQNLGVFTQCRSVLDQRRGNKELSKDVAHTRGLTMLRLAAAQTTPSPCGTFKVAPEMDGPDRRRSAEGTLHMELQGNCQTLSRGVTTRPSRVDYKLCEQPRAAD